MKTLFLLLVFVAALAADTDAILWPQGSWPLCSISIFMPGCYTGMPTPYMLEVRPDADAVEFDWTIIGTVEDGSAVQLSGTVAVVNSQSWTVNNIDFGQRLVSFTITVEYR